MESCGGLKVDNVWPPLELLSVKREGQGYYLQRGQRINKDVLSQAISGRFVIAVSIFGQMNNKACFIDEFIRLTYKKQMTSDRKDPEGLRMLPVTGTIDGRKIAILFIIGEEIGAEEGKPKKYEEKIMEACLSLCHIALFNSSGSFQQKDIDLLIQTLECVSAEGKQLSATDQLMCILIREMYFTENDAHNPTADRGETALKRFNNAFPVNFRQCIDKISKEAQFKEHLLQFSSKFDDYLRKVIQETDGELDSFWKVLRSFGKNPSETESQVAATKFKKEIEAEEKRIATLIEKWEGDKNSAEVLVHDMVESFDEMLLELRTRYDSEFIDCEKKQKKTKEFLKNLCKEGRCSAISKIMRKIEFDILDELENMQYELDEIVSDVGLRQLAQNAKELLNEAEKKIEEENYRGREFEGVTALHDDLLAVDGEMRRAYRLLGSKISHRQESLESDYKMLEHISKMEMQRDKALKNVAYRAMKEDPSLWNSLHYRDQIESMAESAFAKHLSGDVGFRQPEKQGSASKGVSGKDGLDGESWGMPGEAGSDGFDGASGADGFTLAFTLKGTPEEFQFKNWLSDSISLGEDSEDVWLIDLRGQNGGDGGKGMKGGDGAMGKSGEEGCNGPDLDSLDGEKGGKGGNAGKGGNGGDGGDGGNGGDLFIKTKKPELLMLLEFDLRGGFGGKGGLGGLSGEPGRGGLPGMGHIHKKAGTYRLQGIHGRPGPWGESGAPSDWPCGIDGRPGHHGVPGRLIIQIQASPESTIDEFGISRYNIEVESFDVEPVLDDDIIEQNEVVAVKNIVIRNTGGITLPKGAVLTFESKNEDIDPISPPILLPSLQRDEWVKLEDVYYFRVHQWIDELTYTGRMRSQCFFFSTARLLGRRFLSSIREGNLTIKSPITISNSRAPECCAEGVSKIISFWVTNESKWAHGAEASPWGKDGRVLSVDMLSSSSGVIEFEVSILKEDYLSLKSISIFDETPPIPEPSRKATLTRQRRQTFSSPLSLFVRKVPFEEGSGFASSEIPHINPSSSFRIDVEVELTAMAPVGHQCQIGLVLKHRQKTVEKRTVSVRAIQSFSPTTPPADVLYFSLPHQTETELYGWKSLLSSLSLTCQFWDVEGYGGISFEDGEKSCKRDCSFWNTHQGSILIFPFRNQSDLDLLHPNDVLAFLSCQPLPLPIEDAIVGDRVRPGSVIFLGLKKNVIYQWLFSSPFCSVGLKEMKEKDFGTLTGKLRGKAIEKEEKNQFGLYRMNAEIQRYDNFAAMDESAFQNIQMDQDYDWDEDKGGQVEEKETIELVEEEVDPDSIEGVTNSHLRHHGERSKTISTEGTSTIEQSSTKKTSTFTSSSVSKAMEVELGSPSTASSSSPKDQASSSGGSAVIEKKEKITQKLVEENKGAQMLRREREQDLYLSEKGTKINAFAIYEKLPLPIHTKLFTITSQTLPSLCCNDNVFVEDMKDAILDEFFEVDRDSLEYDIHHSLTFLLFMTQLHDILSSLLMAMSPAKKISTAKYLLDNIEADKGVDGGDLDTSDITSVVSEDSLSQATESESENFDLDSELPTSTFESEEDPLAEKERYELEKIENTKEAQKIRKRKEKAKYPETMFEFEKPWEWQFFYLNQKKSLFRGRSVSRHNLVQMLFSSIVEDVTAEAKIVERSYPIRSQHKSTIKYYAKVSPPSPSLPNWSRTASSSPRSPLSSPSSPIFHSPSPSISFPRSSSTSPPLFSASATISAPTMSSSASFDSKSMYGVGVSKKKKQRISFIGKTKSWAPSFPKQEQKILHSRYKEERGSLSKQAYFLERVASNDVSMVTYLVEGKSMTPRDVVLKSEPTRNKMGLQRGDSYPEVVKRNNSNEVGMYLKQVDAREREIKEQTKVVNDGAIKIASFAPEFPALQDALDLLAFELDSPTSLMFRAFAKEILRRLRAVLPPEAKMILPKESLSQAMEALKKNTMRATTREQKLIRKCAAAMKLRPSDYKLEKMKKYSGIQLPFYESLALIPLQDLRVKEVKKEVVETAVGRRRYAIWEPQGLEGENLKICKELPRCLPYPSHHHRPLPLSYQ